MERLRPDDHFMILAESDATPMQIGALILLDVPPERRATFAPALRDHLLRRLPATPLLKVRHAFPDGYDSDAWLASGIVAGAARIDIADPGKALDVPELHRLAAAWSMERLDLAEPPFKIRIHPDPVDGRGVMLVKVHHALVDGVGFQSLMELLADSRGAIATARRRERPPPAWLWRARAWMRFRRGSGSRAVAVRRRADAMAEIKRLDADPATSRARTPALKLSGPTSSRRSYATLSLPFAAFRGTAKRLGASVNDLFLAIAATALRDYLIGIDDLPGLPLVASAARSYRRPAHGPFGNRIVALNPTLATDVADPIERLRAIQHAMTIERLRTAFDEALLDQPETPFGPRDRAAKLARRSEAGERLLPGNVTLSNVPGPAEPPRFDGMRQVANYPIPLLASGRFLNITVRRGGDALDFGIMADADKIADVDRVVTLLRDAAALHAALADGTGGG